MGSAELREMAKEECASFIEHRLKDAEQAARLLTVLVGEELSGRRITTAKEIPVACFKKALSTSNIGHRMDLIRKRLPLHNNDKNINHSIFLKADPSQYRITISARNPDLAPQESRDDFRAFWGCPFGIIPEDEPQGLIVLQCDQIDALYKELAQYSHLESAIDLKSSSRFFKARTIINRWDTDGAQAIRDAFQQWDVTPPQIAMRERHPKKPISSSSPLVVSMGLGHTGRSINVMKKCGEWMGVKTFPDCGDALSLHSKLIRNPEPASLIALPAGADEFRRLLPLGFDLDTCGSEYINAWLSESDDPVQDYAIILRYTEKNGQVEFLIGGFTERSTAIGAAYLTNEWQSLWSQHRKPQEALGDFLLVIAGPSNSQTDNLTEGWEQVLAVDPRSLSEADIPCEWKRRIDAIKPARQKQQS